MNPSKKRNNWITVGEVMNLVRKPIALYTDEVVTKWHSKLCRRLKGRCASSKVCEKETDHEKLCHSCNQWYRELVKLHRSQDKQQIKWRKNCDTSKWPTNPWEVAKFFMPILGQNKGNTKDAKSTDLSSLLNVLEWMDNVIFTPDKRVDLNLVRELRSKVRNPWAHAPNLELSLANLNRAFDIANKILAELVVVFNCKEVTTCIQDIKLLKANGLTCVSKSKLNALLLQSNELTADVAQLEEKLNQLEKNQISDRQVCEKELQDLKKSLRSNTQETERRTELKNCIPDKHCVFIGRDNEVEEIIFSLVENAYGIVSIVGGPGFGKTTIAIEVSHLLRDNHDIIVLFSKFSYVTTVSEVFLRLCRDFGVTPGEDPESSFTLWLKGLEEKVVLVMDNVEQLLEKVRSEFTDLVLTLRKNSQQQLQILTTTRTVFSDVNQETTFKNIQIEELDDKASVEILKKFCPNEEVEDSYLRALAKLCGFNPLALCIAGSIIPSLNDPAKMIQWLKEKPMEALISDDESQCVQEIIDFSFQMLSKEDQEALARLSVFKESFQIESAQEVIGKNERTTQRFLRHLVNRSLLQTTSDKRYVIHLLIRRFLADHDQFQHEKATGEELMVTHFLKLCNRWTEKCYSKDEFINARKLLKKDAHNVEEMLKICSKRTANPNANETTNPNANVIDTLASSDIYKFSSRFFFNFARDLLSQIVLRNFHESCLKLAESRKQVEIEITFRCLVAKQEGQVSAYKSSEYIAMMEAIKEAFDKNKEVLKADMSTYCYCYYFYARYYTSIGTNDPYPDLQDDITLKPENMDRWSKVDEVLVLLERVYLNKRRAGKIRGDDRKKYEDYMTGAKSCCEQALSLAEKLLGEHELTCACYKWLGDLYLTWMKNKEAEWYYSNVIELRKKLKLDSNDSFVYLLKNYGLCLSKLRRFEESVKFLKEALEIANKLTEEDTPCKAQVNCELAKTYRDWKDDCQEASKYAKVAKKMQKFLHSRDVRTLEDIIKTAEYNMR